MPNKFPQKHPFRDGQEWEMAEWLQLPFCEPNFWKTKEFSDALFSFPSAKLLHSESGPIAPRDLICRNGYFLDRGIENFIKLAEDGNNQALLALARLAASICESLNEMLERDEQRVAFIAKRVPVWPINLVDRPNVLKELDALLKTLCIGREINAPYDIPRSLTKGKGVSKEVAMRLVSTIDALDKFGCAKEEREIMQAELAAWPEKHSAEDRADFMRHHTNMVDQWFEAASKHLEDFAVFLGVKNPFTDFEAVYKESRTCHELNKVVGRDAWAEKGIELLERFTDDRPEQCRVFGETGKSKAEATLRDSGKKSGPLPKRSIATGIRGQVKRAFKVLRRADGTLGTPPSVSWSERDRIEKFLATGILPELEIIQKKRDMTER